MFYVHYKAGEKNSSLNKIKFHIQASSVLQHYIYILNYYVVLKIKFILSFKIKRALQLEIINSCKSKSSQISFSVLKNFIVSILLHLFEKNVNFSSSFPHYQKSLKMSIRTVLITLTFSFRIGEYDQAIKLHSHRITNILNYIRII